MSRAVEPPPPDTSSYFDEKEFEVRAGIEGRHFWHVHRREVLAEELRRYLGEVGGPLIELGCGIGTVATHLNRSGFRVDYADVFPSAVAIARRRAEAALGAAAGDRRFETLDVTRPLLPLDHRGALLLDVIEHLPDDVRVLRNVHAALPDAAFVLVTVPAFDFLWSPWDDREKHKRRYTQRTLEAVLEQAGFRVGRLTCFFGPLFWAALGVKGLRMVRTAIAGPEPEAALTDMAEARDLGVLNEVVRRVLALEKPALRFGRLPLGTSLLAIAEKV